MAEDITQFAQDLVPVMREAGEAVMKIHGKTIAVETKTDGSPLSQADTAADEIITAGLAKYGGDLAIVSEEHPVTHALRMAGEPYWLVDPLDGTKEFIKQDGNGDFTINIALIDADGRPQLGLVYAPAVDRLFVGGRGMTARDITKHAESDLVVRKVPQDGAKAVVSSSHADPQTQAWLAENGISQTTSIGSSLKFCLVAAGEADVYPRYGPTMEWDTAAGDAVLRAAGGKTINPDGTEFFYGKPEHRNGPFIALGSFEPSSG